MPRVFVVNEPLKKNDATGAYERFLPMETAANFGEVVELTPKGAPPANLGPYLKMIADGLADWRDGDFLVLVGDQALLAYAAATIGDIIGSIVDSSPGDPKLRVLKWERRQNSYSPLTLESA